MTQRIKKNSLLKIILITLMLIFAFSSPTHGQSEEVCEGLSGVGFGNSECEGGSGPSISETITTIIDILSIVAGIIAVVMIIIAGTRFITSGGDSQQVSSARTALIYALIGIVVVAISQIVVQFVLGEATVPPAIQNTEFDPTPGDGGNTVQ